MLDLDQFDLLTFDCYGTLIDWESGIFSALHPILDAHGKKIPDSQILETYAELEAQAEQGEFHPYREVLQSVVCGFGKRLGFTPTPAEIRSLPDSLAKWNPFPDTVAALRQLQSRHRMAIISNVDDDLFASTAPKLGITFDHVITAQKAKAYKPSLKIFELAIQRTGVAPGRWLHVGQSIYHDVIPARSLGLATVWVNRPSPRLGIGAVRAAAGERDLEVPNLATLAAA